MVDKTRGEAVISLGGKSYTLVPTYKAITEIEGRLDKGTIELIRLLAEQKVKLQQIAVILSALIEDMDEDTAGELIVNEGIVNLADPLSKFLIAVASGGSDGGSKNGEADRK